MTTRRKAGSVHSRKAAPRKKAASRVSASASRASARSRASALTHAAFPADFTIAQAGDVQKQLARIVAQPASVTLNLSVIRRIDTAGLQVLMAFIRERRAAGHAVDCAGATDSFTVTAQMLGLGAVFA
jgi:ABC-type transporter Mla MlaB component